MSNLLARCTTWLASGRPLNHSLIELGHPSPESAGESQLLSTKMGMQKKPLRYSPWKGTFYFIYNNHPFWFRSVEEKLGIRTEEVVTVSCFGSPTILKQFFNDCRAAYLKLTENKTTIFEHRSGKWKRTYLKSTRLVSGVVMNEDVKQELLRDIESFLEPKAPTWHANRGIPYRRRPLPGRSFPGTPVPLSPPFGRCGCRWRSATSARRNGHHPSQGRCHPKSPPIAGA